MPECRPDVAALSIGQLTPARLQLSFYKREQIPEILLSCENGPTAAPGQSWGPCVWVPVHRTCRPGFCPSCWAPAGRDACFSFLEPSPVPGSGRALGERCVSKAPTRGVAKSRACLRRRFQALKSPEIYFLKRKICRKLQRKSEPPTTATQNGTLPRMKRERLSLILFFL